MEVHLYVYDLSKVSTLFRNSNFSVAHHIFSGHRSAGSFPCTVTFPVYAEISYKMSASLLGIHIDAVYHTALVFGGIEYFFGAGVQTSYPGATHHGKPMEVVPMGTTYMPVEVILEYLESLKEIYTMEVRYQ